MKYLIGRISCYQMNDSDIICVAIAAHDYNLMSASIAAFESSQESSCFTPDDIIEIMRASEFAEQAIKSLKN